MTHPNVTPKGIDRFWSKVDRSGGPDACWLWMAGVRGIGYGRYWIDGTNRPAHRIAWELTNGPVPDGLFVCHRCDTPRCVNPSHLFVGTAAENSADMVRKGRSVSPATPRGDMHWTHRKPDWLGRIRGEAHGQARLTDKQVAEIRRRYAAGGISQMSLSREFGVTQSHICRLVLRQNRD